MNHNFLGYNQDQQMLLSKDLRDWVEEDSLDQFVSDTIDVLDEDGRLEPFYPEPRTDGRGRPRFHPVLMVKVLVFAYCKGIRSSRTIARLLERHVAFRFLAANQQPDFRTICNFRRDNREAFSHLFVEILDLCREAGMVDLAEVAVDGRWVQGDSAVAANRNREQLEDEIDEILDEAAKIDEQEDEEYGPENRGDELPDELQNQKDRLERLRKANAALEERKEKRKDEQIEKIHERAREERATGQKERGRKPTPPEDVELNEDAKVNVTDPESTTMKSHGEWRDGYNGQVMVDCSSQVIGVQDITTDANDKQQLDPMLERCEETNGRRPEAVLADTGYWSTANAHLADEQTELFIATTKDWKRRNELREQDPPRGQIPTSYGPKERMERKLRTKRGRRMYAMRSTTVEPVFGQHVNRGFDRFLLRGKKGARAEWSLFSATHNLLKHWRAGGKPQTRQVAETIAR